MNLSKRLLSGAALTLAAVVAMGAAPLPYYNSCDDISTVTTYNGDSNGAAWGITTFGVGTSANNAFSYVPGTRSNSSAYQATGTVWTPALDIKDGKAYKVSFVMGAWYTATTVQQYTKQEAAMYSATSNDASKTVILSMSNCEAYNSSKRPSYTVYFKGEAGKPYLGLGNRGSGNITRFSIDDIRVEEVDVQTPDIVTGMTATAAGKNITVSFTLPLKSVIQETLGTIGSVRILRDGVVVKEWTGQTPGASLTYTDLASSMGDYTYSVVCSNNGFDGEAVSQVVTVSPDNTVAPNQASYLRDPENQDIYYGKNYQAYAVYEPGEGIRIRWIAYTLTAYEESQLPEGADATVSYTVVRLSDGKIVADDLQLPQGAFYGEVLDPDVTADSPKAFQYQVRAKYTGGEKNPLYSSNIVSLGNPVPFTPAVSAATLNEFTVRDEDRDNYSWGVMTNGDEKYHGLKKWFSGNHASLTNKGDDWLITPGIRMEAGKSYRLDVDVLCSNLIPTNVQWMVAAGRSNRVEALTDTLIAPSNFEQLTPETWSVYYNPAESGDEFIGFRIFDCTGDMGISRFTVSEVPTDTPKAIDIINVAFHPTQAGKATLSFDAPTENITGAALQSLTKIELYRNGTLLDTYSNPQPGQTFTRDIEFDLGTQDIYKVIPYSPAGAGLATTAKVMILEPPYSNSFEKEADLTGFTIINPSLSGYTWGYMAVNQAVRCYPDREDGHDDHLITPPIHLEKGSWYKLDFRTWLSAADTGYYYDNQLEVLLGAAPTAEAMTDTVIKPFYVRGGFDSRALAKEWFTVPATGEYYLAWHAMSAPRMGQEIYVDDIHISDKIPGTYPGGVTDLQAVPDPEGELKTTVSFSLPEKTLDGDPLTSKIYEYRIFCDGMQIANGLNQDPGKKIEFVHTNPTNGVHLYTVTCYGEKDAPSRDEERVIYVGINRPSRVGFVEAVENNENYGEVTISWSAPTVDVDGFPLNTTDITYTVGEYKYNNTTGEVIENVYEQNFRGLEYTKVVKSNVNTQEFMRFFVRANTAAGKGTPTVVSKYIAVGIPFSLPFVESFPNSNAAHTMLLEYPFEGTFAMWGYNTYNPVTGVQPVDGDKGLCMMEAEFADCGARLYTARVNLNVPNPVMTFYLYNQSRDDMTDMNSFGVSIREGNGAFKNVAMKTVNEWTEGYRGWQKVQLDLSEYAGKVVYIGLDGLCENFRFIHLDHIVVGSPAQTDVSLRGINQEKAYVGVDHAVKVTVKNYGASEATNVEVKLNLDGDPFATETVASIAPGAEETVIFTNMMGRDAIGIHQYDAEVAVAGDADLLDNKATAPSFSLNDNNFPTVKGLTGAQKDDQVTLSWEAPAIPEEARQITDDFESYPSWSTMASGIGDYTLLDKDGYAIGGFQDLELPNVAYGSKQSYTLWDFTYEGLNEDSHYRAHSGDKCLVSIYNPAAYEWTDDWLISPRLTGQAQTISFWAKAYDDFYTESFEVGYSTGGMRESEFTPNMFPSETAKADWKLYTYELPEGANYFVIRHYSRGGYFLFIDDLTYTPIGDETLVLKGYNVYRNGNKANETPLQATTWSEPYSVKAKTYGVTAVYDRGESPIVEADFNESLGIASVNGNVKVYTENGEIIISGAEDLNLMIASAGGLILTNRVADAPVMRIPAAPGVYVVRVADKSVKVIVK